MVVRLVDPTEIVDHYDRDVGAGHGHELVLEQVMPTKIEVQA